MMNKIPIRLEEATNLFNDLKINDLKKGLNVDSEFSIYIHHEVKNLTFEQWLDKNRLEIYEEVIR